MKSSSLLVMLAMIVGTHAQFNDHMHLAEECTEDQYKCQNERCVPSLVTCDGFDDCLDGSDEAYCSEKLDIQKCESGNKFVCHDRKACIPHMFVCNGYSECEDRSDEIGCEDHPESPANSSCAGFKCGSEKCISWHWVCDGYTDCSDKSDETEKSCFHKKSSDSFHNGTVRLCPDTERLDLFMFYCRDRSYCLPHQDLCNGVKDCRDGSDEGTFCLNWSTQCNYAVCEESCKPTPQGPRCKCDQAITQVNSTCDKADYCGTLPSTCSQYCVNGNRSFSCSCQKGYREEGNLCFASDNNAVLYYTTEKEIRSYNIKTREDILLSSARHPHSAVTDGTWIYWIQVSEGNHNVMKAELNNIDRTKEVFLGIGLDQPDELAIDWLGNNIYLTESQHGYIAVCKMSGAVCARLRDSNDIKRPRLIALDPENGLMYWADYIKVPRLQRAKMDGTDIDTLTLIKSYPPSAMTLDIPNRRIYWAETLVGISVMNFDGTGKYEFVAQFIYAPNSLAVFENDLYWDDHVSRVMQSTSKMEGDSRRKELFKIEDRITGVSIYHPLLHRRMSHACENSLCSHLCVVTGHSTSSCLCGEGVLGPDRRTCSGTEAEQYLIVVGGSTVTKVLFHQLTKPQKESTTIDIGLVHAVAYNPTDKVIYIFDTFRKVIHRMYVDSFKDGIKEPPLVIPDVEDITDMSFDYLTGVLYYIEVGLIQSKLELFSVKTNRKSHLHTFEDKEIPISVCVIPEYGTLMVAVYENKDSVIRVDRMSLDGSDRFNVYQTKYAGFHVSVTYSPEEDLVFIADPGQSVIEQIHPEGTGLDHFRKVYTSVVLMTSVQKLLFWVNKLSTRLYWANIDDHVNTFGNMELSKFTANTQLYLAAVHHPKDIGQHPCLSGVAKCSHICVQQKHNPLNTTTGAYTCLCPPGQFLKNDQCINKVICAEGQLNCYKSNTCYSKEKYCDGVDDCPKREDEMNCPDHTVCRKDQYNCPYTERCISRHKLCDGHADCADHSDEDDKYCPMRQCQSDEFKCSSGLCIFSAWVCDGEVDCQDGSDEHRCVNSTCDGGSFRCRDGQCIDLHLRCDGRKDCLDWSDEEKCINEEDILPVPEVPNPVCEGRDYICPTNRSICLPLLARCDGKNDCPDGVDESGCDTMTCPPRHFRCKNWLQCVPYSVVCNRKNDCEDGSDESRDACYYKTKLFTSTMSPFPEKLEPCVEEFRCRDNSCIDYKLVCNGVNNCLNGDDEGGHCATACTNRPCHHICRASPTGPQCQCHPGYTLDKETNRCTDVDECSLDACSQDCSNVIGSYVCSCYIGYALRNDGQTCKSTMGNVTFLYISGKALLSVGLHQGVSSVVYDDPNVDDMVDLDYDPKLDMLYVTTRKELIAIDKNLVVTNVTNMGVPTLVSADWITGNVYMVDATPHNQTVRACNLRKNLCAKIHLIPDNFEVQALSLDPINRKMFYCAWDNFRKSSSIYIANLSGGDPTLLQEIRSCTGLVADHHKRALLVAQADGRIRKMSYSGRWSKDLITPNFHLQSPLGLQLFEDHVYSVDAITHRISRCLRIATRHCEAHIYKVINAKAFVIRHERSELGDGESHCNSIECGGDCKRQECDCYEDEERTEGTLCIDIPAAEYYSMLPKPLAQHHNPQTAWIVTIVILLLLICIIGLYMWKKEHRYMRTFTPSNCCTRHRRIVRQRLESGPHDSWQYSDHEASDTNDDAVKIHVADAQRHSGITNTSFVNWFYSSFSRKQKETKYQEPSVSVHLKKSQDKMAEPLAGTSRRLRDQKDDVVSDTESELDVKDIL